MAAAGRSCPAHWPAVAAAWRTALRMSGMSLARRVALSAAAAVLAVVAVGGTLLWRALTDAVIAWERTHVSAVAHHVAEMAAGLSAGRGREVVVAAGANLGGVDIRLDYVQAPSEAPPSSIVVPVAGGMGFVAARAGSGLTATLRRRLGWLTLWVSLAALVSLLVAVQFTVHSSLVVPLRSISLQIKHLRRGGWRTEYSPLGANEVRDLAKEITEAGSHLETSVAQWVGAERRGAVEVARIEVQRRTSAHLREANLAASQLLAEGRLTPTGTRALRHMLAALDDLTEELRAPYGGAAPGNRGETQAELEVRP